MKRIMKFYIFFEIVLLFLNNWYKVIWFVFWELLVVLSEIFYYSINIVCRCCEVLLREDDVCDYVNYF